jgi:hypothetical protein
MASVKAKVLVSLSLGRCLTSMSHVAARDTHQVLHFRRFLRQRPGWAGRSAALADDGISEGGLIGSTPPVLLGFTAGALGFLMMLSQCCERPER